MTDEFLKDPPPWTETVYKMPCPGCSHLNFVSNGDESDVSGVDVQAVKCWSCKKVFPVSELDLLFIDGEDANPENWMVEDGEYGVGVGARADREWRDSITGLLKTFPEFESLPWEGDKEGWGFCFELIKVLAKPDAERRAIVEANRTEKKTT